MFTLGKRKKKEKLQSFSEFGPSAIQVS